MIDLNVGAETIKPLEQNKRITLYGSGQSEAALMQQEKYKWWEGKIAKLDIIKIKNFCVAYSTIKKMKG